MIKKKERKLSNSFRVKIEYEEIPITDSKVKGIEGLDSVISKIKKKIGGSLK